MNREKEYLTPEISVTKFDVEGSIMGMIPETTHSNDNPQDIVTREWESQTPETPGNIGDLFGD